MVDLTFLFCCREFSRKRFPRVRKQRRRYEIMHVLLRQIADAVEEDPSILSRLTAMGN
jgi:hypothetical protein